MVVCVPDGDGVRVRKVVATGAATTTTLDVGNFRVAQ